jgi:hypothetical protein
MENDFEKLLDIAKKAANEARSGEEEGPDGGPAARHTGHIQDLLKKEKELDIILDFNESTHEQFVISREAQYACVSGGALNHHYLFTKDFKEFQAIITS